MNCEKHPDRDASLIGVSRRMCLECQLAYQLGYRERAYGTGIGKEAHGEAQESKRYNDEFQRGKIGYRETWRR
jgi:hypothetical protein